MTGLLLASWQRQGKPVSPRDEPRRCGSYEPAADHRIEAKLIMSIRLVGLAKTDTITDRFDHFGP
jgi:hypothetical protein